MKEWFRARWKTRELSYRFGSWEIYDNTLYFRTQTSDALCIEHY